MSRVVVRNSGVHTIKFILYTSHLITVTTNIVLIVPQRAEKDKCTEVKQGQYLGIEYEL